MPESEKISDDALNRRWQHGLHEDEVFNNRLNFFLLFESILLSVFGSVSGNSSGNVWVLRSIGLFGAVFALLWIYVQARSLKIVKALIAELEGLDPLFQKHRKKFEKRLFSTTELLTYLLPLLVLGLWAALLVSAWNSGGDGRRHPSTELPPVATSPAHQGRHG
jgi:hypothetical protein